MNKNTTFDPLLGTPTKKRKEIMDTFFSLQFVAPSGNYKDK